MAQAKDPGAAGEKKGDMRIDTKLVRELAELLSENSLTEIAVEDGDRRITVKREAPAMISAAAAAPVYTAAAAPALSAPPMHAKEDLGASPDPGAAPDIEVGKTVKAGDTLLIVEAMKVMNPITAPEAGTVKKVMISDGQPVEFDQPLVIIG
jgi:acetyl-CoA carboxylase biotin carboxyl carrier protein